MTERPKGGRQREDDVRLATHRALADGSRVAILGLLRRAERPLGVSELAERLALRKNTVRSHLAVLLRSGLITVESEGPGRPGRPRLVYEPKDVAPHTAGDGDRLLAEILAAHLTESSPDPRAAAVEAGSAWGRYLIQRPEPFARVPEALALQRVNDLCDKAGFESELLESVDHAQIRAHRCPFRDLASSHPDIACSVHLGLISGALAELAAPVQVTRLDAFVRPSLCVAHVARRGIDRSPADPHERYPQQDFGGA